MRRNAFLIDLIHCTVFVLVLQPDNTWNSFTYRNLSQIQHFIFQLALGFIDLSLTFDDLVFTIFYFHDQLFIFYFYVSIELTSFLAFDHLVDPHRLISHYAFLLWLGIHYSFLRIYCKYLLFSMNKVKLAFTIPIVSNRQTLTDSHIIISFLKVELQMVIARFQ